MWIRILVALSFAGAVSAAAELEFSHQLHLGKVGLQCNVCHASVAGSDAATDNNLPQAQLCLVCHNGETAPKVDVAPLEDRTPAPRSFSFSHQQHLELGNVAAKLAEAIDNGAYLGPVPDIRAQLDAEGACVGCHRGMEQSTAVDASVDLPHMADCLVCHDQIDNPFTCETCHAPDFPIKPENHTREFIDAHSTGVLTAEQKLTCQPCHGRNFRCMGCH